MAFNKLPSFLLGREGELTRRYSSKQAFHQEMGQRVGGGQVMSLGKTPEDPPSTIWVVSWRLFFFERKTPVTTQHELHTAHCSFFGEFLEVSFSSDLFFSHFWWFGGRVGWQQGKTSTDFFFGFFLGRFTEKCDPNNNSGTGLFFSRFSYVATSI